jgi:hypothetical protein
MRKNVTLLFCALLTAGLMVVSCDKKSTNGIGPTYGSTGNPNANNQTTTGSTTYTSPATNNTGQNIGGNETGWSFLSCATTNSLYIKAFNGPIDVTLNFPSIIKAGTYTISPSGDPNTCALTILNPKDQPAGITWYGQSGIVTVITTSNNITAKFNGVTCTQQSFSYPTVTASGTLTCSQ